MAIVFLGNGLNQLDRNQPSWSKLLESIATEYNADYQCNSSMTLGYEFFEENIMKAKQASSKEIKNKIAQRTAITSVIPAEQRLLKKLFEAGIKEFITTNYDYAVEVTANADFKPVYTTRETRYSIYRTQHSADVLVHHVHGECAYPGSICLGYEQYAGTLEKCRSLLTKSTSSKGSPKKFALYDVLSKLSDSDGSWLYRFFTEDIYFLGFGLDFSEMDIWWLITYRAQLITEKKAPIHNRIVYFETGSTDTSKKKSAIEEKRKLLETFYVDFIQYDKGSYSQKDSMAVQSIIEIENKKRSI